jgi:hypothetical protein
MKNSCPESPPREPWLPPRVSEKSNVVCPVDASKVALSTPKTHENQRPARHECTTARERSLA